MNMRLDYWLVDGLTAIEMTQRPIKEIIQQPNKLKIIPYIWTDFARAFNFWNQEQMRKHIYGWILPLTFLTLYALYVGYTFLTNHELAIEKFSPRKRRERRIRRREARRVRKMLKIATKEKKARDEKREHAYKKKDEVAMFIEQQETADRKLREKREEVATLTLDYTYFTPENGYPYGPSRIQRQRLEKERMLQKENRVLSGVEMTQVNSGLAAGGGPFGGEEHEKMFLVLFQHYRNNNYEPQFESGLANMPPIQKPTGNKSGKADIVDFKSRSK